MPEAKRDEVPLPEPVGIVVVGTQALRAFTADQLLAYGRQCAQAAAELRRQHQAIVELREVVNEFFSLDEALLKDIYGSEFVNAARATLTKHQET